MSEEPKGPKLQVDSDYSELPAIETDVFIAGSGPIGATFCRKILEENSLACVYMAEIGSQDHPVIGAHHKNSVKYHKDIDSFVHVIQGALQPISVPPQSTFMSTLGEVAWTPGPGQHLIQSYHNPNQKPEENLMSYMTRTVGGMATHWTCACPMPDPDEMKNCPLDEYEFKSLLKQAQKLLSVNTNEFDHSIRHNLVKQALIEHYSKDRIANLPLAVTRCPKNPEFAIWSGVDTILGGYIDTQKDRFTLATETRVTKLIFEPAAGSTRVVGALCRDLRNNRDYVVRAKR